MRYMDCLGSQVCRASVMLQDLSSRKMRLQSNHGFLGGYIGIDLASSMVIWLF